MSQSYRHLFGPVPSRRFGRSLGIDLTPFKTCSFDCIFCQLGKTTSCTLERKSYVNLDETLAEIKDWMDSDGVADQITLAGSGEPTLNSDFGKVIEFVKNHSNIPVALLTNGSMLYQPEVRQAAALADIVKISLSAWDQNSLEKINRPANGYDFKDLIEGESLFRKEFSGKLYLEVFILKDINSFSEHLEKIAEIAQQIRPDRIQLNTCVRPTAEQSAVAVSEEDLHAFSTLFKPEGEVIADYKAAEKNQIKGSKEAILQMLKRRPCTAGQIAKVFKMHPNEVAKYLGILEHAKLICASRSNDNIFYQAFKNG